MNLPPRTIERLSKYRRLLEKYLKSEQSFIFSHNLASLLNLTPVQVRRDLMLIGLTGNHRKGYNIKELVSLISSIIDQEQGHNIAVVGMGNLGRAVNRFIRKNETRMNIVAGFDVDAEKVGQDFEGVICYHVKDLEKYLEKFNADMVVLTTSPESARDIAEHVVAAGVKGILNFTSVHLDVPKEVYLKDYDIITSLEEIGFFIKNPDGKIAKPGK